VRPRPDAYGPGRHDRGGTIDRIVPGGLTAFYNAPLDDPDHAIHGCESALSILNSMEKVNRVLEQGRHPDGTPFDSIGIGIGLNTGPGIVGNFGTENEPDYAATGHAATMADEIEKLSTNYGTAIVVGHATRALAERSFAFLEVDVSPKENPNRRRYSRYWEAPSPAPIPNSWR